MIKGWGIEGGGRWGDGVGKGEDEDEGEDDDGGPEAVVTGPRVVAPNSLPYSAIASPEQALWIQLAPTSQRKA